MARPGKNPSVRSHAHLFELTGGRLCLDFANTVDNRPSPRRKDLLGGFGDLLSWGYQTGILSGVRAEGLSREAAVHPRKTAAALQRGKELREAICGIFSSIANRKRPPAADLALFNKDLKEGLARSLVVKKSSGFSWEFNASEDELDQVLWPVARSAMDLLISPELGTIRECAASDCAWLFLDGSKNKSRRWCDMKVCGNRSKVRHFRQRATPGH